MDNLDPNLKKFLAWQIEGDENCHRCDGNGSYCSLPLTDLPNKCPQKACMSNYVPCAFDVLCTCADDRIRAILKSQPDGIQITKILERK